MIDYNGDGSYDATKYFGLVGDKDMLLLDWNGDGKDDLVVVRDNGAGGLNWYIDLDGQGGMAELVLTYGLTGDIPLAGDLDATVFGRSRSIVESVSPVRA